MSFGAALSEHPIAAHATGEVVGSLLEQVGDAPDLAMLFVTRPHIGALEDVVDAIRQTLRPGALVGATAVSVIGGTARGRGAERTRRCGRRAPSPVRTVSIDAVEGSRRVDVHRPASGRRRRGGRTLVLLADPTTLPGRPVPRRSARPIPICRSSAAWPRRDSDPGATGSSSTPTCATDGAVGVLLTADQAVTTVVSQGCRPIGDPYTVTRAERNVIYEIGGRPALERLQSLLGGLDERELEMAREGLHLGRVIDEHQAEFGRGDFLVRNVLGGDRDAGAIAVGDEVHVGDTVQFQVRDAESADEDLRLAARRAHRRTGRSCSRATDAGGACSAGRTTTPKWSSARSTARRSAECSAPVRSARSVTAASCTASPPRSRFSGRSQAHRGQ